MKTFKKILLAVLMILPAILTAAWVLFFLPDTVPAHFGADGTADRYGSKYESFILPGIVLLVGMLYLIIRRIARKTSADENARAARNLDVMDTVMILVSVLFNALNVVILLLMSRALSLRDPEGLAAIILSCVVGVVFILLGVLMPKTKRNALMGMRLSFAMDSEEHWAIANRSGGVAMIVSGLTTVAAGLILRSVAYVFCMVGALIVTLTVAIIYSYVTIKKEKTSD